VLPDDRRNHNVLATVLSAEVRVDCVDEMQKSADVDRHCVEIVPIIEFCDGTSYTNSCITHHGIYTTERGYGVFDRCCDSMCVGDIDRTDKMTFGIVHCLAHMCEFICTACTQYDGRTVRRQ
jgi:hypothetical protein